MAVAILVAGAASAQMSFGIDYVNLKSTTEVTGLGTTVKTTSTCPGFAINWMDNINLAGGLNVAPGLNLEYTGKKSDVNLVLATVEGRYTGFDVTVPVLFNYGFNLSDGLKLSVFAGPEFDLALVSKWKAKNTDDEVNYLDGDDDKQFGVNLEAGVWLDINDTYRIKGGYNYGLTNWTKANNTTQKTNNFFVGVAYIF